MGGKSRSPSRNGGRGAHYDGKAASLGVLIRRDARFPPRYRPGWLASGHAPRPTTLISAPPLFPGYCFLTVEAQWYAARWSLGVIGLIMDGIKPARVADQIIDDLRKRNGLMELPKRPGLKPGDQVWIL